MVLETYLKLGVTAGFFSNFFFAANMWKMDQKRTQMVVFLTENVVIIILLICSLIKFLLFAVLLRKSYIGKILFLRYGPNCNQPTRFQDL